MSGMTRAEALQLFLALYPPGYDQVMDTTPGTNFHKFSYASSGALKTYGSDVIDTLRTEINPGTCIQKIPDWESALGLDDTPIAKFGTTAQRRSAIIAKLRESGSSSLDDIRAVVQPYFNYAHPEQIEIIEMPRSTLTLKHTYAGAGALVCAAFDSAESIATIADDPMVSPAGATIVFSWTGVIDDSTQVALYSPNFGYQKTWGAEYFDRGAVAGDVVTVRCPEAGRLNTLILGDWKLTLQTGPEAMTIDAWVIFVEGLYYTRDNTYAITGQGLGAAMFEWTVIADMDKLGTGYDLGGAFRALRRTQPAHTRGYLAVKPSGGGSVMIYDLATSIFDAGIFG